MNEILHAGWRMGRIAALGLACVGPSLAPCQVQDGVGTHKDIKPSTALKIVAPEGQVTLSPDDVEHLPQISATVHNAHTNADERYTGVRLTDLLAKGGVTPGKGALRSYLTATGTDGYWVIFSGEEISDLVHSGTVLVATQRDGKPLGAEGAFKLISTEDKKPERWVRNLQSIQWVQVKP